MDTLPAHKAEGVRQAIEVVGCQLLYHPPIAWTFNPTENAFSKLKALLQARAKRTVEALWDTVGEIVAFLKPQECSDYFTARALTSRKMDAL